jgi:pilus assembly protein CpaC
VFRNYGIILTMRPTLTDDDTIILQIRADVTNIDPTTAVDLGGAIIPGETVRSVNTTLTIREGDTIVMGGLITNERSQITSRIPVLSNIPIIGALFRSKRFQNNESELAIFMTPRITRTPASLNTREDVQRVPALPDLPANQATTVTFGSGGAAAGSGG